MLAACEQRLPPPGPVDAGPYTHAPTGLTFPAGAVDFRRTEVVRPDHAQVFVGYAYPPGGATVVVTAALSPIQAGGCDEAYAARKRATANANPGVTWIEEAGVTLRRGDTAYPGRVAVFHFDIGGHAMRGEIFVYCPVAASWQLSYRISMPRDVRADERIAAFMEQVPDAPAPRADSSRR